MLPRLFRLLSLLILTISAFAAPASASRRVALVVGNGAYTHVTRLQNPVNDAQDMQQRLTRLGFDVITATDANSEDFDIAVQKFAIKLQGADLALFFYAGHGLQFEGVNYLMPVDARVEGSYVLRRKAVLAQDIIDQMEKGANISLVFLDACRNNELLRKLEQSLPQQSRGSSPLLRGLARMDPRGSNTLIAFATLPGEVAADGIERNSPFTTALLRRIETPGVIIQEMLTDVTADVMKATDGRQKPEVLSRLATKVVLRDAPEMPIAAPPAPASSREREAAVAWGLAKSSCVHADLEAFRSRYADTYPGDLAKARLTEVAAGSLCAPTRPTEPPKHIEEPTVSNPIDDKTLVRSMQAELRRVGCYEGGVDGSWGNGSTNALRRFNQHSKSQSIDATPAGLAFVKTLTDRVCPLRCEDQEEIVEGLCKPKVQPAYKPIQQRPSSSANNATPKMTSLQTNKSSNSSDTGTSATETERMKYLANKNGWKHVCNVEHSGKIRVAREHFGYTAKGTEVRALKLCQQWSDQPRTCRISSCRALPSI
jgi:peptidoglycan hydrolase-like protein with peptidoglycan-binding domain